MFSIHVRPWSVHAEKKGDRHLLPPQAPFAAGELLDAKRKKGKRSQSPFFFAADLDETCEVSTALELPS
jgi:hypothetical protein